MGAASFTNNITVSKQRIKTHSRIGTLETSKLKAPPTYLYSLNASLLKLLVPKSEFQAQKMKVTDGRVRVTELVLRCAVSGLSLLALLLIVTDTQVKHIFTIEKKAKYTDMKALVFLVAANGIAAVYSLLQSIRCALRGSLLFSKPLAWAIFSVDQGIAYISVAAIAAAAETSAIAKDGLEELQWMKVCNMYGKFCNRAAQGAASALFAAIAMVLVSCISAFSLFRLYGATKDRQTST